MPPNTRLFLITLLRGFAAVCLALIAAGSWVPARAQEASPLVLAARAGFDGYYRDGYWLPVRVTLTNNGSSVDGQLRVATTRYDGTESIFARSVSLPTQSHKEFFMYVNAEGYLTQLKVEMYSGTSKLATANARVSQAGATDLLYGVVAGSPSAFNALADVDPVAGAGLLAQLDLSDVPEHAQALKPLDVLVFSDVDTGQLSEAQRLALKSWVSGGGRLIVAGGPGWQKTAAGLDDLLPVQINGTQTLQSFDVLNAYAGGAESLAGPSPVAVGTVRDGSAALLTQDAVTLLAARRMGYGEVDFLAFDPSVAPFNGWTGASGLYRKLFSAQQERPSWAGGFSEWYQASEAVYAIPGLNLPSALQLCGFLGLYVVAIGPINYFVLRRFKRREMAWLTIPALVLAFSGLAYLLGYRLRGSVPILHRLAVVQVWPDSDVAQVDGLVGVFSPRRDEYEVAFGSEYLVRPLPSSYTSFDTGLFSGQLEQGDGTTVKDLRVEVGGITAFVAQGQMPAPRFEADLKLDISGTNARLIGTITNASQMTLHDPVLLGPGAVLRLNDFAPGDTQSVMLSLSASRATPAQPSGSTPVLSASVPPISPGPVRPYYGAYDTTVDDVLGTSNYYDDKESYRKYSLLRAAVNPYGGVGGRGSGVFLAGWGDSSPIAVKLEGDGFTTNDTTAYLIALRPQVELGASRLELPPGLFNWSVVDAGQQGSPTPYDMYVYQGSYALEFTPIQPLAYQSVESLTLHFTGYGAQGRTNLAASLWDYTQSSWVAIPDLQWGDTPIQNPERFVGPGGEIQLRVENQGTGSSVSVEASDFTLAVGR